MKTLGRFLVVVLAVASTSAFAMAGEGLRRLRR